jgi:conjugal transfer pilus assembly protein TraL
MNEETMHLMVPRRLDDPPKFIFWDFDVAICAMGISMFGIMAGYFLVSAVLGIGAAYGLQKMKSGQQAGYAIHLLYWHLPMGLFKRTPPSCVREFIG